MTDAERIAQLTDRQKQCLRLYYASLEVKEIGAELGLSPNTVKKYLGEARQTLRTSRSIQAARLLVEYERDTWGISPPSRLAANVAIPDDGEAPERIGPGARNRYSLPRLPRMGLIVAIAFGVVALAGALLAGAETITRILIGYEIDLSDPPYRDQPPS